MCSMGKTVIYNAGGGWGQQYVINLVESRWLRKSKTYVFNVTFKLLALVCWFGRGHNKIHRQINGEENKTRLGSNF